MNTNDNGVLCRNARANVQKHAINYRANYVGEIYGEEELGMKFIDTYEYQEGNGNHYVIEAIASYELAGNIFAYIVVGGLFLLAVLIVLILFVLSKKNKKKEE